MAKFFVTGAVAFAGVAAYCGYREIIERTDHRMLCRKYAHDWRTKAMNHHMQVARATPNSPESHYEKYFAEMATLNSNYWMQKEKDGPHCGLNCPSQLLHQEINKKTREFWARPGRDASS